MPDIAARRWIFLFLVLASTGVGVLQLWSVLRIDGLNFLEFLFLSLFAILFGWIAASFWMAIFGAWARLADIPLLPLGAAPEGTPSSSRTAILMPVYNEDVARVFSGVAAICESAILAGAGQVLFDFYILSDSTDPAQWVAEEIEWQRLRAALSPEARIFYRHRHRNIGRKSGNIQDFCENWGALYEYMVVLDADSLMTGETLVALVRLMDANPRTGLIQAPAQLIGRHSLFARLQQFASAAYGPVYTAGLAYLQGADGNYWGHNAIIRVRAFLQAGGLPKLPGKAPFGGEIMSHDFVEAALLRRAGWEVWMAPDLGGSYEEPPPSVHDFLKRDRRWLQGNLQHTRILFAQGLTLPSRLHMAMGVMSYLSSPLWLLLLVVSAIGMATPDTVEPFRYFGRIPEISLSVSHARELLHLTLATLLLLYGPKLVAILVLLRDREQVAAQGGVGALLRSVACESIFSTLFAPVVMLAHSWFLITLLTGFSTGWGTQTRTDRALPFLFVLKGYWPHTLVGVIAGLLLAWFAPDDLGWFLPLLAGLLLTIPMVAVTSSLALGEAAARDHLFLVPSETRGLAVLDSTRSRLGARERETPRDFRRLVLEDRGVCDLHLALLRESPPRLETAPADMARLVAAARARDTDGFTRQDWVALLSDPDSVVAASV